MRRMILMLTVAALMVAALTITAAGAFAAPQEAHGTYGVGGPSFSSTEESAFGCAGNVGGFIVTENQGCREINQGPFSVFEGICSFGE